MCPPVIATPNEATVFVQYADRVGERDELRLNAFGAQALNIKKGAADRSLAPEGSFPGSVAAAPVIGLEALLRPG